MSSIYVLRHAKSDWSAGAGSDEARPLSPRGIRAAELIGRFLSRIGEVPELVLCSPARRTQLTLELAMAAGDWGSQVLSEPDLYAGNPATMLRLVQQLENLPERVMLVGHEPTCSGFISELVGGGQFRFPTAALARIDVQGTLIAAGRGQLEWMINPRTQGASMQSDS